MTYERNHAQTIEDRLQFFASLLDIVEQAVIATDATGRIFYWNGFAERLYGWSAAEAAGRNVAELLVPAPDRERGGAALGAIAGGTRPHGAREWRLRRRDGGVILVCSNITTFRDGQGAVAAIVGVSWDITQEKRLHEELQRSEVQLRALSRRLLDAQEMERRAVARELHDDFGQLFTVIRLNLEAARRAAKGEGARRVAESVKLVDQAIDQMRNLALDLRPAILDDLGLVAALRWLLKRQLGKTGVEARLSVVSVEERFPTLVETCSFRVVQEALTNVLRHADARHVDVELRVAERVLHLQVRDDGAGFDVDAAIQRGTLGGSVGLLSMQERVTLSGGRLEIRSRRGQGTTLEASIPIHAAAPDATDAVREIAVERPA